VDAEAIAAGKKLQVIGSAGVGVTTSSDRDRRGHRGRERAHGQHGRRRGNNSKCCSRPARRIPAADASVRRGEWKRAQFTGRELHGKTLGVIGLGKIGMTVAEAARGLEMDLIGYDPFVTEEAAARRGIRLTTVADILRTADAICVHVPLTAKTKGA
jgi:D-3-phosphoglycerate dehydrogenase